MLLSSSSNSCDCGVPRTVFAAPLLLSAMLVVTLTATPAPAQSLESAAMLSDVAARTSLGSTGWHGRYTGGYHSGVYVSGHLLYGRPHYGSLASPTFGYYGAYRYWHPSWTNRPTYGLTAFQYKHRPGYASYGYGAYGNYAGYGGGYQPYSYRSYSYGSAGVLAPAHSLTGRLPTYYTPSYYTGYRPFVHYPYGAYGPYAVNYGYGGLYRPWYLAPQVYSQGNWIGSPAYYGGYYGSDFPAYGVAPTVVYRGTDLGPGTLASSYIAPGTYSPIVGAAGPIYLGYGWNGWGGGTYGYGVYRFGSLGYGIRY